MGLFNVDNLVCLPLEIIGSNVDLGKSDLRLVERDAGLKFSSTFRVTYPLLHHLDVRSRSIDAIVASQVPK